jgi:hypothetical protein
MPLTRTLIITLAVGAAAGMSCRDAEAGTVASNAVDMCNGALPGFEGALRKRPLAIANEGGVSAFVTCSFTSGYNIMGIYDAVVYATNRSSGAVNVTCTFVNGLVPEVVQIAPTFPLPTYYPVTVALAPGQFAPIAVVADDYGLETFPAPYMNVNCNIPPDVEMNLVGYDYDEPPAAP